MTQDELDGMSVCVNEIAAMAIKRRARAQVVDAIATKVIEKYKDPFIKDVARSITMDEVRQRVIDKIVEETVRDWAKERGNYR